MAPELACAWLAVEPRRLATRYAHSAWRTGKSALAAALQYQPARARAGAGQTGRLAPDCAGQPTMWLSMVALWGAPQPQDDGFLPRHGAQCRCPGAHPRAGGADRHRRATAEQLAELEQLAAQRATNRRWPRR